MGHVSADALLRGAKLLTRAQPDTLCALPCSATSPTSLCQCWAFSMRTKTPPALDSSAASQM